MSHRFYWLDQIQVEHRSQLGGNAIYLSQLAQHQLPVPQSIVVPATEFQRYFQQHLNPNSLDDAPNLQKKRLENWLPNPDISQAAFYLQAILQNQGFELELLQDLKQAMQSMDADFWLLQASIPESTDPQLMQLWTPQICPIDELAQGLERLWNETFCARNLCYWQQHHNSINTILLATLIQPLSKSRASGTLWVDRRTITIHGFWGLRLNTHPWEVPNITVLCDRATGEIQSQQLSQQTIFYSIPSQLPDLFIDAEPLMIVGQDWLLPFALENSFQDLLEKQCLNPAEIQTLVGIAQKIWQVFQTHLQANWQIDWRFDGKAFSIQSCQLADNEAANFPHRSQDSAGESSTIALSPVELPHHLAQANLPLAMGIAAAPGEVTARAIVISDNQAILNDFPQGCILVTSHLTPEWLPLIRKAAGVVTEQGGTTSHAAILARELGIPAIVGVAQATQHFQTGDWLHLRRGKIYAAAEITAAMAPRQTIEHRPKADRNIHRATQFDPGLNHLTKTQHLVTISQIEQFDELRHRNVDGIGLIRAEHLLMPHLEKKHPWLWIRQRQAPYLNRVLTTQLRQILSTSTTLPIWYRTADWRSHELNALEGAQSFSREQNPILGIHGAVSYQQFPEWLDLELNAIAALPQANLQNLRLLFPFVRTVEEFRFCQKRVQQAGLTHVPLWIMAEVPAVIFSLSDFVAAGVKGITIGMNDLVQLLFAIDRDQPLLSSLFNPNHPAIRQSVAQLIQSANQLEIPCNVCSLTEDEEFVEFLIQCGVTGISANIQDLDRVKQAIIKAESAIDRN